MKFGFDLLRRQMLDFVESEHEWLVEDLKSIGESEIERLLLAALVVGSRFGTSEYRYLFIVRDGLSFERVAKCIQSGEHERCLIAEPQVQFENWRVDFVISALDCNASASGDLKWRKLIVECDGHDFHERTKEQATRDRGRDRCATLLGIEVFRFTGSELWRDPLGCASQIFQWAAKGWP